MEHLTGRSVSRRTYEVHGCRCDDCRAVKSTSEGQRPPRLNIRPTRLAARENIEQAIARGETTSRIMAAHGVTYETVAGVRERMDRCAA